MTPLIRSSLLPHPPAQSFPSSLGQSQEFGVTSDPPDRIDEIISQGRLFVAVVRNPATAATLKSRAAYAGKDAAALEVAFHALEKSETDQETSKSTAGQATDVRSAQLNSLYDSAAKYGFRDRAALSPFRIGVFLPKEKGDTNPRRQPRPPQRHPSRPQPRAHRPGKNRPGRIRGRANQTKRRASCRHRSARHLRRALRPNPAAPPPHRQAIDGERPPGPDHTALRKRVGLLPDKGMS